MGASSMPPQPSTVGQGDLETKQVRSQITASWAQVVGTVISAAAVIVAVVVAKQGQETVNYNAQSTLRQSEDSQLSTAITALGSGDASERVAGLVLLARNASARFALSTETHEPPADVYGNYVTALHIFSGYLSSHGTAFLADTTTVKATTPF